MNNVPVANKNEITSSELREGILDIERKITEIPGATFGDDVAPLDHIFGDGLYIRKIVMPAGMLLTSKIHKKDHPYFIMEGLVTVLTDEGETTIKAPFAGMTKAGTKRVIYVHERTVWITVHAISKTNLKDIEEEIISKTFDEVDFKGGVPS
jgi:hypothetical protein